MELPQEYKDQILAELNRPKAKQRVTEDLFIELERALTTVERAMPDAIPQRDSARRVLLKKFKSGIIKNRVDFRNVAKIARAQNVGYDTKAASTQLKKLFQDNRYSIDEAYANSVGEAYKERDVGSRVTSLLALLDEITPEEIDDELKEKLRELQQKLNSLLEE